VSETVTLLKHGRNVPYKRCDACGHYVRELSKRDWCEACESEYRASGLQKVADARRAPVPTDPAGSTAPASDQTPEGSPG